MIAFCCYSLSFKLTYLQGSEFSLLVSKRVCLSLLISCHHIRFLTHLFSPLSSPGVWAGGTSADYRQRGVAAALLPAGSPMCGRGNCSWLSLVSRLVQANVRHQELIVSLHPVSVQVPAWVSDTTRTSWTCILSQGSCRSGIADSNLLDFILAYE